MRTGAALDRSSLDRYRRRGSGGDHCLHPLFGLFCGVVLAIAWTSLPHRASPERPLPAQGQATPIESESLRCLAFQALGEPIPGAGLPSIMALASRRSSRGEGELLLKIRETDGSVAYEKLAPAGGTAENSRFVGDQYAVEIEGFLGASGTQASIVSLRDPLIHSICGGESRLASQPAIK